MPLFLSSKNDQGFVGPVTINWSNPSSHKLVFFPWFNGGPPVDLVNGYRPTTVSGTIGIGEHKGIFNTSSTGGNWIEWSGTWVTGLLASKTEMTMMLRFTQRTTTANVQGSFMSLCEAAGGGYNIIGNSSTAPSFWINAGSAVVYTGLTTYADASVYTFFVSGGADATRGLAFQNGGLAANVSTAAISTSANVSRIRIGQERGTSAGGAPNGGGFANIGEVHYAAIWQRRLSVPEMFQLAEQPYSLVRQQRPLRASTIFFRGWGQPIR